MPDFGTKLLEKEKWTKEKVEDGKGKRDHWGLACGEYKEEKKEDKEVKGAKSPETQLLHAGILKG